MQKQIFSWILFFSGSLFAQDPGKIQVNLGFHVNLYHSYRGDDLSERGFGKDIRILRKILDQLEQVEQTGMAVKISWDFDHLFSLQEILPKHAPDIISRIKARVQKGSDKILIMSYNNALSAALTDSEFLEHIGQAISNKQNSGALDVFESFSPIYRPQEMMFSPGQEKFLKLKGIKAMLLFNSSTPFSSIPLFAGPLGFPQEYLPFNLGSEDQTMAVIPSYHIGDIAKHLTLKRWIQKIRNQQLKIPGDVLLNINFDADVDFWTGHQAPLGFKLISSLAGLKEILLELRKLSYVQFTHLEDFLEKHPPTKKISIGQDLADGSFDGFASWSDKLSSQYFWTCVHRSRILEKILNAAGTASTQAALQSNFDLRMRLLSSTHFGMATPQLNADRLQQGQNICDQLIDLQKKYGRKLPAKKPKDLLPVSFEDLQLKDRVIKANGIEVVQLGQLPSVPVSYENGVLFFEVSQYYDPKKFKQVKEIKPLELKWLRPLENGTSFKVIKKNFHGFTSEFELDYWKRSEANLNLGSTNNAVTCQWLAVSDGKQTLILFFDPRYAVNMAAVPLRLQTQNGKSVLYLNPYGVYEGKQPLKTDFWSSFFDLGRWLTLLMGEQFKSGAVSFVGGEHRFRLGLAVVPGSHVDKTVDQHLSKLYESLEMQTDFLNFPIRLPN